MVANNDNGIDELISISRLRIGIDSWNGEEVGMESKNERDREKENEKKREIERNMKEKKKEKKKVEEESRKNEPAGSFIGIWDVSMHNIFHAIIGTL